MKKVYLSGKIAGLSEEEYKQNFAQAAMDALAFFPDDQVTIVNPATLPAIHNSWADYLLRDLMLLKDCDAIVMLPNWEDSKGATTEYYFATGMGIEIHYLRPIPECRLTKEQVQKISEMSVQAVREFAYKRVPRVAERMYQEHRKRYEEDAAYHDRIEDLMLDPFVSGSYEAGFIVAINYMLNEYGKQK